MYYVYHIHLPSMGLDEGYVGISVNPKERLLAHKRGKENYPVQKALVKYADKIKMTILEYCDTLEDALWTEFCLRPLPRQGWNLVCGGGFLPDSKGQNNPNFGKMTTEETKERQSKARVGRFAGNNHPRARLADVFNLAGDLIAQGVVIRVWAKQNGFHQAHLAATATGKLKQHKGIYARYK